MVNLKEFKIIRYNYILSNEELTIQLWDKMNFEETRWAVKLTLEGVNDSSSGNQYPAWDMFFLESKLEEKISNVLFKYNIEYVIEDLTEELLKDDTVLTEELLTSLACLVPLLQSQSMHTSAHAMTQNQDGSKSHTSVVTGDCTPYFMCCIANEKFFTENKLLAIW